MKPTHCFAIKLLAVLLFTLLSLSFLLFGGASLYLAADGYFDGQRTDYSESALCQRRLREYCWLALAAYQAEQSASRADDGIYADRLDKGNTNFRYEILNGDGAVVFENIGDAAVSSAFCLLSQGMEDGSVQARGYLTQPLLVKDAFSAENGLFQWVYPNRGLVVGGAALSLALCILLFVYLLCAAGRHSDNPAPRAGVLDRIPFDLYVAVSAFILFGLFNLAVSTGDASLGQGTLALTAAVAGGVWALATLILLSLCMTFAARIKLKTLWSNNVIALLLRLCGRLFRLLAGGLHTLWLHMGLLWRYILAFAGIGLFELISISLSGRNGMFALLFVLGNAGLFVLALIAVLQLDRLKKAGERLAAGELHCQVDTGRMLPSLRQHGENLNRIGQGMSKAVEARMKSERMKTDLITNVSHDLKTPLTSIVSYVDLLKKEPLSNPKATEYVEVLDRQAAKLTKLTKDLVEASKATSGVLSVSLCPVNAGETLAQSAAEYQERFSAAGLTAVTDIPPEPVLMTADGRLIWRVMDNLLSNAVKYSMPGTRVYCAARREDAQAVITVKNVSREALNISPEELTERFVRGDQSRAGEGSGLGLSIAKSLMELMGGRLELVIDGDLFTAVLRFPIALENA